MKSMIKRLFTWLWEKAIKPFFARFHDKVIQYLDKILKAIGIAGVGGLTFAAYKDAFDETVDKFGIFARILQIDDVFNGINNSFGQSLNGVLNTDFIGVCGAFGIITAVNEILSAIGWSFLIFVALMVLKLFVNGALVFVKAVT